MTTDPTAQPAITDAEIDEVRRNIEHTLGYYYATGRSLDGVDFNLSPTFVLAIIARMRSAEAERDKTCELIGYISAIMMKAHPNWEFDGTGECLKGWIKDDMELIAALNGINERLTADRDRIRAETIAECMKLCEIQMNMYLARKRRHDEPNAPWCEGMADGSASLYEAIEALGAKEGGK